MELLLSAENIHFMSQVLIKNSLIPKLFWNQSINRSKTLMLVYLFKVNTVFPKPCSKIDTARMLCIYIVYSIRNIDILKIIDQTYSLPKFNF